jgi:predicted PurR-regulated permease PerM
VFLGVIAVATLATAVVQIALLLAAAKLVRRLEQLTDSVEQQLRPLLAHLDRIGADAARTSSLVAAQVERVDDLFGDVASRLEQAMDTVQSVLSTPMREGQALLAGFRAVLGAVKDARQPRGRTRGDDEDALFI